MRAEDEIPNAKLFSQLRKQLEHAEQLLITAVEKESPGDCAAYSATVTASRGLLNSDRFYNNRISFWGPGFQF